MAVSRVLCLAVCLTVPALVAAWTPGTATFTGEVNPNSKEHLHILLQGLNKLVSSGPGGRAQIADQQQLCAFTAPFRQHTG
jgi:hypothetical protein